MIKYDSLFSLVIHYLSINKLEAIQFCQVHTNYSQRKTNLREISTTKSISMVRNKLSTLNIIHKDEELFAESDMVTKIEQTEDVNVND